MPRVSVCMPLFRHKKHIEETVQSVLGQSYKDFEIIVATSGATKNAVKAIKRCADPRIRLIDDKGGQGPAFAMSRCIAEANGEFIGILKPDDAYFPLKLEKQVNFLETRPEIMAVYSLAQIIDHEGKPVPCGNNEQGLIYQNRSRFAWLNRFFFDGDFLCHASLLARRACYTEIHPPDPRLAQLDDFCRLIKICLNHGIYIIGERLVKSRLRAAGAYDGPGKRETMLRNTWETGRILRSYLQIKKMDDFKRIFPDFHTEEGVLEEDLIPFYIARLSLSVDSPVYHAFALDALHGLLGDRKKVEILWEKHNFGYRDFHRLVGRSNIFNLKLKPAKRTMLHRVHASIKKDLKRFRWRLRLAWAPRQY